MLILLLSATGFITLLLFDIAQIYNRKALSAVFSIIGYGTIVSTLLFLIILHKVPYPPKKDFALVLLVIKVTGALFFFLLLLYSNIIEIGLKLPYSSSNERVALDRGTYGIVRHPGFLWLTFLLILLALVYKNGSFTLFSALIICMNFLLILIEDIVIFPKLFKNYTQYKRRVPFLIPDIRKIIRED